MNLPLIKPVCDLDIKMSSTFFKWFAIAEEAILYKTDSKEIGLQFFKNSRGLFPLGRQLMM